MNIGAIPMKTGNLVTPPVPDLACVQGETVEQAVEWLTHYYEDDGCPWNYRIGTRAIKAGYRGLHRLDLLTASCAQEKTKQGRISNAEIIRLAAPIAFGRSTQVFDLPARQFAFGRTRQAAYRIPFFFVEGGIVKLYFIQPRKHHGATLDQLGMIGKIHKKYLLDTEFFGQTSDVEYVNLGAEEKKGPRVVRYYSLDSLNLWSDERLEDRLTLIAEALDKIEERGILQSRRRPARPEPEMPLFD
jgi:hypothetical protein